MTRERQKKNVKAAGTAGRPKRMITCPSCGAAYEDGLTHCPYCRSVDDYRDESEFMEDLEEIRDKVEDLPTDVHRESVRRYREETVRDIRMIIAGVIAAAAAVAALVIVFSFVIPKATGTSDEDRREKKREEYLWREENFPVMDAYYEAQDWEGLLAFVNEADNSAIYRWQHFSVIEALQKIGSLRDYEIPAADRAAASYGADDSRTRDENAYVLRDELLLRFWEYRTKDKNDAEIVKELAAEELKDLTDRFALSQEELDLFETEIKKNSGELSVRECSTFFFFF